MRQRQNAAGWRAVTVTIGALGVLLSSGAAQRALAASSTDYPGPCSGEATATSLPATPLFLSTDVNTREKDTGVIILPEVGRLRLGISCFNTRFVVVLGGPDSALCRFFGFCTDGDLSRVSLEIIFDVMGSFPGEVPFFHDCTKHGFGWYDVVGLRPGRWLAFAESRGPVFYSGHGTMDTYAFFGNGGQYQPVNCAPPGGGGGGGGGGDDGGGGGGMLLE